MRKIFYKAMIEDVQNEKCTPSEQENLLNSFEYTIKDMATTLARKSFYDLKDFATAKHYGIDNFKLIIERREIDGQEQFHGVFENGVKKLNVIGTLEEHWKRGTL